MKMKYYKISMPDDELQHHGILGQRWGVRRYQREDGSLTPSGRKRYEKEVIAQEEAAVNKKTKSSSKKEEKIARGKKLNAKGETKAGIIVKSLLAAGGVSTATAITTNAFLSAAILDDKPAAQLGAVAASFAGLAANGLIAANAYKNISSLEAYDRNKK